MITHLVAAVATAVVALHSPGQETNRSDSVDVLLFAAFDSPSIRVASSHALRVDGEPTDDRSIAATAESGRLLWRGAAYDSLRIESKGSACTIEYAGRSRTVDGTIVLHPENESIRVIARIDRTAYLAGALASETIAGDPTDYLAAIAVLQRNYLDTHRRRHGSVGADLCDATHCQLFDPQRVTPRIRSALRRADDIDLSAGDVKPCYYSANCGGATLTPGMVWDHEERGYASVRCNDCRRSRWHRWERSTPATRRAIELFATAPSPPFVDDDFKIRIGRAIGFNVVLSNTVDRIERRSGSYVVFGRGFGHRVGLCQDGARTLARSGHNTMEILRRYFPTATLEVRATRSNDGGVAD